MAEIKKPLVVVQGPVATRSGYGDHTRDLVRSLISLDKYDIRIVSMDVDGQYTKEEFINKIKTDGEFTNTRRLKIKERELDLEERRKLILKDDPHGIQPTTDWTKTQLEDCKIQLDEWKIPTKLITITYNNEIIESYE